MKAVCLAMAAGLSLALAAPALTWAATPTAAGTAKKAPAHKAPAAKAPAQVVDRDAVKALRDMSTFLQSLSGFDLTSQTSLDLVANDGQKIQLDGVARYKVRKPNAFTIDVVSDDWNRRYIYDGRQFTLYAPKLGYYATVAAPPTIKGTVDEIENKFGISLPLDDLFRWSSPDGSREDSLDAGFMVGTATIDGVATRHYAFREGQIDWQVWIQQGDQPLPRKLVIVDRRDPADPAYIARLNWTLNPTLSDADFAFQPDQDAKRVRLVLFGQ
jgi:hypothetical protein